MERITTDEGLVEVSVAWEALEDAFENNAPEVHSYLHTLTGEVIRIVDGIADPAMHNRIMSDGNYLRVDPVSSREQYRWMERFISTIEDDALRHRLTVSIDGKGAFRRFKDVLMNHPEERELWFVFRSDRLQACMDAWLTAHGIEATEREIIEASESHDATEAIEASEPSESEHVHMSINESGPEMSGIRAAATAVGATVSVSETLEQEINIADIHRRRIQ
ncbi:MAG: UPF0158 family protein [Polyangiales bacterium]